MDDKGKKVVGCGCLIALILPFVLLFGLFAVPVAVDNIACAAYAKRAKKAVILPDGAVILDVRHACGNTSGTGDHTEMVAALLIESKVPLDAEDLSAQSGVQFFVMPYSSFEYDTPWLKWIGIEFNVQTADDNYYVVVALKSAPMSWLDIRGM